MSRRVEEKTRNRKNKREPYKKLLIVCEGTKTEINYFKHFKPLFYKHKVIVTPFKGKHTNADGVVQDAIDYIKNEKKEGNPINLSEGDKAWCVFDRDKNSINQLNRAKQLAIKHKIDIIFSNPCFEIWYIFHFTNRFGARNTPDDAKNEVKKHLNDNEYHKDGCIYKKFEQNQATAINNAAKLTKQHTRGNIQQYSIESNPSTNVPELVCYLTKLLNELNTNNQQ